MKFCAKCGAEKPLDEFHKQPRGPQGRHSYCKPCANELQRATRVRLDTPANRKRRLLGQRYGLTPEGVEAMKAAQAGLCAICAKTLARPVVDHCHATGKVRAILCHGCNVKLHAIEDGAYLAAALAYLERHK